MSGDSRRILLKCRFDVSAIIKRVRLVESKLFRNANLPLPVSGSASLIVHYFGDGKVRVRGAERKEELLNKAKPRKDRRTLLRSC